VTEPSSDSYGKLDGGRHRESTTKRVGFFSRVRDITSEGPLGWAVAFVAACGLLALSAWAEAGESFLFWLIRFAAILGAIVVLCTLPSAFWWLVNGGRPPRPEGTPVTKAWAFLTDPDGSRNRAGLLILYPDRLVHVRSWAARVANPAVGRAWFDVTYSAGFKQKVATSAKSATIVPLGSISEITYSTGKGRSDCFCVVTSAGDEYRFLSERGGPEGYEKWSEVLNKLAPADTRRPPPDDITDSPTPRPSPTS